MPLIVQKYGGSSLATPKHIQRAAQRIQSLKATGADVVVVASAMGHSTDHLLKLANKTVKHPPRRELDMLLTAGERVSMALLAMALHEQGVPAISFTGSQSGILTSSDHTEAKIISIRAHRIEEELKKGKVVIIAGFQGVSQEKEITTLGRGGSDTTAVALAAALKADRCEILTDVNGLYTADPRLVPNAKLLPECSYDEALELASLGAKMHARSIEVAKRFEVKVRIASSFSLDGTGTELVAERKGNGVDNSLERTLVRGVATKDGFHYFKATASLTTVVNCLESIKVPLRFFGYQNEELGFLIEKENALQVKRALEKYDITFEETTKICLVSAVGEGLSTTSEVLPTFLKTMEETGTECLLVTSNSISISAAIPSDKKEAVARALHDKLVKS